MIVGELKENHVNDWNKSTFKLINENSGIHIPLKSLRACHMLSYSPQVSSHLVEDMNDHCEKVCLFSFKYLFCIITNITVLRLVKANIYEVFFKKRINKNTSVLRGRQVAA